MQKRATKAMKRNSCWGLRKNRGDGSDSDNDNSSKPRRRVMKNGIIGLTSRSHFPVDDDTQYRLVSVDVSCTTRHVICFQDFLILAPCFHALDFLPDITTR